MSEPIWKYKANIILGLIIIIFPWLGVPIGFKHLMITILATLVVILSFVATRQEEARDHLPPAVPPAAT